jgi:hypothetical protein
MLAQTAVYVGITARVSCGRGKLKLEPAGSAPLETVSERNVLFHNEDRTVREIQDAVHTTGFFRT